MADNKDVKRGIVLYLDGKEVKNNATSIKAEMKKVRQEIDNCTIGSEEYVAATQKYQQLNAILVEHKNKLKGINDQLKDNKVKAVEAQGATKNWLKWGIDKFNAYSVAILGAAAALTGVTMKLMAFKNLGSEKQESQANLKALTGLDDDSIAWLTQQAEILSTTMEKSGLRVRKSSREILDAYMLVGSAKPELLQDKEALNAVTIEAMRLAEAAKMNLKDAVDGVTLALNQYGDGADHAARYVNVLAAGSKAGAAGVEAQTASIIKSGVAASVAKVPIEQLVGSIETLAEKGIKGEIAGTGLKTFFLKLEGGAKDCRPSVVGLQQALENLQAKNMSATEMQKMFGLEAYTVAQAMISGAASVKKYTEAVTDTNVAMEQAAINSGTDAAKLDQRKNKLNEIGIVLAKRLAPVFSQFINLTGKFVQAMPAMLDFLERYGVQIAILAGSIYLYNVRIQIATAVTAAYNAVVKMATGVMTGYRLCMMLTKDAVTGCSMATTRLGLALRNQNIITIAFTATTQLLRAAWFALTLQFTAARRSLKAFNVSLASSGWGALILAVGMAAGAVYEYVQKQKEANEAKRQEQERLRESMKGYNDTKAKLKALNKIVEDETVSLQQRKKALEEIKEMVPGYHGELTEEGKLINDNKIALDNYLESLKKVALFQANKDKLVDLYKKQQELQDNRDDKYKEWRDVRTDNTLSGRYSKANSWGYKLLVKFEDALGWSKESSLKGDLDDLDDKLSKNAKEIKELEDKVGKLSDFEEPEEPNGTGGTGGNGGGGGNGGDSSEEARKKRVKKALEDIETESNRKLAELKKQFINGEIASDEEYSRMAEQIELERLQKSLEVAGLEPSEREKLMNKVQDIYFNAKKQINDWYDQLENDQENSFGRTIAKLEDAKNEEKQVIDHAHSLGILSEEDYQKALLALDEKYNRKREDAYKRSEEYKRRLREMAATIYNSESADKNLKDEHGNKYNWLGYYKSLHSEIEKAKSDLANMDPDSEEYKLAEDYLDGLIKIYEDKGRILTDVMSGIGESLGSALGNWIQGSKQGVQDAFKSLLLVVVDGIEKMIEATMIVPTLEAILGPATWAKALADLAKIAAVKVAFTALKTSIQGWESGGYTGVGAHDEPAGIVHRGEFVANRFALANPAIKSVLDLIDGAQRSGSVQNLTTEDISAAAGGRTSSPSAPSAASTPQNIIVNSPDNADLIELLQSLKQRLEEPIEAYTYIEGRGGINQAQSRAKQLKNNAIRER